MRAKLLLLRDWFETLDPFGPGSGPSTRALCVRLGATGFLIQLLTLLTAVSALAQPGAGGGPMAPVMHGLGRRLGEGFTPGMRETVKQIVSKNMPEMGKCREVFARDVAESFGVPVAKVTEMLAKSHENNPRQEATPLGRKLAMYLGRDIALDGIKLLQQAREKQAACSRPLKAKIVAEIAAATGLPSADVEALMPWTRGLDGPAFSGQGGSGLEGPGEFVSRFLDGPIRICAGTVRPLATDRILMPLLSECRERLPGKRVLDIGTGSGIVGLYCAQLGAARVVATDIDPRAIDCTNENARKLGLHEKIETRLVRLEDPSAYSVIRPGEQFDIILGAPPAEANRTPLVTSGGLDEGLTANDSIRLGLSIIDGLKEHLSPDGAAILYYPSDILQPIFAGYARHLGYAVEHQPANQMQHPDWHALFNTYALALARKEGIEPAALLLPPAEEQPSSPEIEHYRKLDWVEEGLVCPQLWGKEINRVLPGIIVIRKKAGADK